MKKTQLDEIIKKHKKWLLNEKDGLRANLWKADLWKADLWEANLWGADLRESDLREADLRKANLSGANLWEANLWGADLREADLRLTDLRLTDLRGVDLRGAYLWEANLREADLRGAYLWEANLREADLRGADLWEADLRKANLREADLRRTVLDPAVAPNGQVDNFEVDSPYIIGYRTKNQPHLDGNNYEAGKIYTAPYFSTCTTECHPGLYLYPTLVHVQQVYPNKPYIKVWAKPEETHKAGSKWRTKTFYKVEDL